LLRRFGAIRLEKTLVPQQDRGSSWSLIDPVDPTLPQKVRKHERRDRCKKKEGETDGQSEHEEKIADAHISYV
jgi:hypothetical protein